jgi:hypothetical protein
MAYLLPGAICEITPLFPWRPASLSPTEIFRICAIETWICWKTPIGSLSPVHGRKSLYQLPFRVRHVGDTVDVSFTSRDFSPKMTRSNRSSAVRSPSPFGVIFPIRISPEETSAPDTNDTGFIEILQTVLTDIRDITSHHFGPKLGITHIDREILDMDRAPPIILHDTFRNDDSIFIVESFPRKRRPAYSARVRVHHDLSKHRQRGGPPSPRSVPSSRAAPGSSR